MPSATLPPSQRARQTLERMRSEIAQLDEKLSKARETEKRLRLEVESSPYNRGAAVRQAPSPEDEGELASMAVTYADTLRLLHCCQRVLAVTEPAGGPRKRMALPGTMSPEEAEDVVAQFLRMSGE